MKGMKKYKILLDGIEVEYLLTKTNRKTIGISMGFKDGLKVAAPKNITIKQIEEVLLKNTPWILEKKRAMEELPSTEKQYRAGEPFLYLGNRYTLQVVKINNDREARVELDQGFMKLYMQGDDEEDIEQLIIRWYREEASMLLRKRINLLSERTGLYPNMVRIKGQKSRFGSCSSKGNINLNWKLIMAPIEVIDYVIVHELCHLKEMNHSKDFWSLVQSFMEDYYERRRWLKEKGGFIANFKG